MTSEQLAKLLKTTPQNINLLCRNGILTKTKDEDGNASFDLVKNVGAYVEYLRSKAGDVQTNPTDSLGDGGRLYLGTVLLMLARGDDSSGRPPDDADRKLTEAYALFEELAKSKDPFYRAHGDIRLVNATMQLRKFDDMPALCETMANRYHDRPEELIVLSFLYTVQARSDRPALAERTLARMTDAFARIPKSTYSGVMEEMTQNYWVTWFDKTKKK